MLGDSPNGASGAPAIAMSQPAVTLASASPRRTLLLAQIGVRHVVRPTDVDEARLAGEPAAAYTLRLAAAKAATAWRADPSLPVLAADTAVVLGPELFGKPADLTDCLRMLNALAGRTHRVLTAVTVRSAAGEHRALSVSEVTLRPLAPGEAERYWATGEPCGKAGGYAIQGLGATLVSRLHGSYSGVMGLPLAETAALLARHGVGIWNTEVAA